MTRIFLLHPQRLYLDVVPALRARGVDIVLACVSEQFNFLEQFRQSLPEATVYSSFAMMSGEVARGSDLVQASATANDVEALASWEGVALQMIDRLNYDDKSVQDLRSFYLRYIGMWRTLLDAHQPDAVVFHGTPHMGHDFVLYELCKRRQIPTLIVERTYLNEALYFRSDLTDSIAPTEEELKVVAGVIESVPATDGSKNPRPDVSHFTQINRAFNDVRAIDRATSWWYLLANYLHPRYWRSNFSPVVSSVHGLSQRKPTGWSYRWREMSNHLQARRCLTLYRRLSSVPDFHCDFVLFPLHFQPERTTVPDGGRVSDQLYAAEAVAAALPAGWKLYVKEHARQFKRGVLWPKARNPEYYERLASIPRVQLVPLECPAEEAVGASRAVVTITGTAGWEAVQAGTPALVFGYPWYFNSPGVHRVNDARSCGAVLSEIAAGGLKVDQRLVEAFATLVKSKYTFRGCFTDKLLSMSQLSSLENGTNYANAIEAAVRSSAQTPTATPPPRQETEQAIR